VLFIVPPLSVQNGQIEVVDVVVVVVVVVRLDLTTGKRSPPSQQLTTIIK
jgi:hypothetical protein